jgi:hypothetical protein
MNAYELADDVKNISNTIEALEWVQKATPLLRQQADRITELEKGGEVAGRFYWESVVDGHVMAVPSEGTPHYNKDDFPLYTTPQIKELSDEEIYKLAGEFWIEGSFDDGELDYVGFARAILKKASQ